MRVLHILDHSLPLQSGYVFRTLGILSAQKGFGWSTVQLTSPRYHSGSVALEKVDGWDFHRTPARASRIPLLREVQEMRATERKLEELIARYRPDILHAHSPVLNGIPALRAARRAKLPLVYEVRAFWEDAAVDLGRTRANSLRYRAIQKLETYVLRQAQGVVTLCEGMRKEIAGRGIPERPNCCSPECSRADPFRESAGPGSGASGAATGYLARLYSASSDLFTIMKALIYCSLHFRKSEPLTPAPFSSSLAADQKRQNCERKSCRKT